MTIEQPVSEAAGRGMIEHSPLAMATTEGPTHKLISVNAAFCALQGKRSEEMIGRPISEAISALEVESVLALLDRVYGHSGDWEEKSGFVNNPQHAPPGLSLSHRSYLAWGLPVVNGHSTGLVIQMADFTERRRADRDHELATAEIRELNREMQQISEQLVLSGLHQQTLADRNRAIAEAMQYSILWRQPETLFPGLKVAVAYEPAMDDARVGGDFFDAFRLPDGSVMLVVGDVTGKGLAAAARTVEIKFALRAFAQDYEGPADMVARLNGFICAFHHEDDASGNAHVVLSLIVVDPVTGAAQAASAGAEPPLVLRTSGALEEVAVTGLPLGIDRDASYETRDLSLGRGDTLLMTTDGLTETRRGSDFFGSARLLEVARDADGAGTLHGVGKAIVDAARAHGGGRFSDDVCLLLVRRLPLSGGEGDGG